MALSTISGTTGITDATITSVKLADFAAAVDLNGVELILDADQDTSITADTDDRIDLKIGGAEHISFNNSSGDTVIKPMADGKDIVFQQYDGNKILEINDGNYVAISGAAAGPGELRFYEDTDNGTHYTGFKAGNATASLSYVLPLADGTDGYQLTTDGSGTLSWAAAGTTLSGSTNNTVVTVTGANALAGEGNLTFDGSTLAVTGAATISSTLGVTGVVSGAGFTAGSAVLAEAELELLDGLTAGTAIASKVVTTDANIDSTGMRNLTITGTFSDGNYTFDTSGNVSGLGTVGSGAITSSGIVTGTGFTAGSAVLAEAELELLDGLTAGTAIASKVVTTDSNIDTTGQRNLTISGELDAATLDISGNADIDGTLEADAITINGTAIGSIYGVVAGSSSIVTTGALDSGSITSGFGAIDNGASNITSGGLVKLDVDADADDASGDSATGRLTLGAGEDLNLYHGGTNSYIVNDTGDLFLDSAGDIILDADGGDIKFRDAGTAILTITNNSGTVEIDSAVSDADIVFKGNDGGSGVTVLTLDMSAAGQAVFGAGGAKLGGDIDMQGNDIKFDDNAQVLVGTGEDMVLKHDGSNSFINNGTGNLTIDAQGGDTDIIFKGTDGSSDITALTLDMSEAGKATFLGDISCESIQGGDYTTSAGTISISGGSFGNLIQLSALEAGYLYYGDAYLPGYEHGTYHASFLIQSNTVNANVTYISQGAYYHVRVNSGWIQGKETASGGSPSHYMKVRKLAMDT